MNSRAVRRHVALAAVALGVAFLAACGGGRDGMLPTTGGGSGISRQFDEYPATLSIEGPSIVESGANVTLQARADSNEYRGPAYLTVDVAQGLSVRTSPAGLTTPDSVTLGRDGRQRDFLQADIEVTAPVVTAPTPFSLTVENPRARAGRTVTVVPAGTLYVRQLSLSQPIVESRQSVMVVVELSRPVLADTTVQLDTSNSLLSLPASVIVAAGTAGTTFPARAQDLTGQQYVTVSATLNGLSQQASLWVRSAEAFVLHIQLARHYYAGGTTNPVPVRLSKPAGTAGLTITLTSNNTFARVPATVFVAPGVDQIEFPFQVDAFIGLSAVRITASGGGTTRIGDALLGRDVGVPEIESLALRNAGSVVPCFDSNTRDPEAGARRPVIGRATITLDRIAPEGGFRINLFAHSSVLVLQQQFSIPAGQKAIDFDFEIPAGTASAQLRFVRVTARAVDTAQERSETLLVGEGGGSDLAELTSGTGSLGQARNYIPYFDWGPQPTSGGVLRGRVTLGEVDGNGNFVAPHPHGADDVPVYLTLTDPAFPPGHESRLAASATLTIPALLGFVDFELPLPSGVARPLSLRADLYSRLVSNASPGTLCDLSYQRSIDVGPGGLLASAVAEPRHVFGGGAGTVTVTLSEPAPAGGAVVALEANVPAALITLPAQVTVEAGARTASVPFVTARVSAFIPVGVFATYGNSTSAQLELMPEPDPFAMRFEPSTLSYGGTATLRFDLPHSYPVPLVASLGAGDPQSAALLDMPRTVVLPARQFGVSVPIPVLANHPDIVPGSILSLSLRGTIRSASAEARGNVGTGAGNWEPLGLNLLGSTQPHTPAVAIDLVGRPVVAYVAARAGEVARLYVSRFDLPSWFGLGGNSITSPFATTPASNPALIIDALGRPVVAWSQGNGAQQNVYVAYWDGQNWRALGTANPINFVASSRAVRPALALDALDRVCAAWAENGGAVAKCFDGTDWVAAASSPGPTSSNALAVALAIERTTNLMTLAWIDNVDTANPVQIAQRTAANAWAALVAPAAGPIDSANRGLTELTLHVASDGSPTVLWNRGRMPFSVQARRWNGNDWESLGAELASGSGSFQSLALLQGSPDLVAAHAFNDLALTGFQVPALQRWTGTAWQPLTPVLANPNQRIANLALATRPPGDVKVLVTSQYTAGGTDYELRAWRHAP